jgi:formamidopyrimidine-DNA glycosylase
MPELPEVETTVRQVRPALVGQRITGVRVRWAGSVAGRSAGALRRALTGKRIERVTRRGKFFVLDLGQAAHGMAHLVGHLRMSGRLWIEREDLPHDAHARVEIGLGRRQRLVFADVRKFGRLYFTQQPEEIFGHLGPEPLSSTFTPAWLAEALGRRRRRIKPLLLDQTFIAGLGNIYTDESLFAARIHPLTLAHTLGPAAVSRLRTSIRRVLSAAIRHEGSSFDSYYRTPEGRSGRYQDRLFVYGRGGRPCRRCGATIVRIVVTQRGTHVCPRCQPTPRLRSHALRRG